MTYSEKLKDPKWQKMRLKVLERDGFKCRRCGATEKTLNVHHLSYSKNPWDTPEEDLLTLCEDCHERAEFLLKEFRRQIMDPDRSLALEKLLTLQHDHMTVAAVIASIDRGGPLSKVLADVLELGAQMFRRGAECASRQA